MRRLLLALLLVLITTSALAQTDQEGGEFITVNDADLYYIERGPADAPVVILVHGFGGSTFNWHANIDAVAEAGYRVIAYDRPPYGMADKTPGLDLTGSEQAARLAQLMDVLEIQSATLVGHSAGGRTIATFAATYPQRVDALVFVAGAVTVDRGAADGGFSELFAGREINPDSPIAQGLVRTFLTPERFLSILRSAYYDPDAVLTPEVEERYAEILEVEGWEAAFLGLLQSPLDEAFSRDDLAALNVPVMLMWGEEDTWVPLAEGVELRETYFPQALWITYDDVGHLPMEEAPTAFNNDLLNFLTEVYAVPGRSAQG
ncbi:MAG: alpha/beta fold hydrolase [Anaerolineae bacterium]